MHAFDKPARHALVGPQATVAEGHGLARRYHPDVAVFGALADPRDQSPV